MSNNKHRKLGGILRTEGIISKGFGLIPRALVIDQEISVTAKAIYGYFCSFSSRGNTALPSRDEILLDLQISKEAYYMGQKELIDAGYLAVTQEYDASSGGKIMYNVHGFVSKPIKYLNNPDNPISQEVIRSGIDALGCGLVPYAVMSDRRLSCRAKATYNYVAAHADNGITTDLSPSTIAYHLGIKSVKTIQGYMEQLKNCNYITITRLYENGRLISKNRYMLLRTPMTLHAPGQTDIDKTNEIDRRQKNG